MISCRLVSRVNRMVINILMSPALKNLSVNLEYDNNFWKIIIIFQVYGSL